MMRMRGLSGPRVAKHAKSRSTKSKSAGNFIGVSDRSLIDNGDFENGDDGWSVGTGWTIAGGVASCDGSAGSVLTQTVGGGVA